MTSQSMQSDVSRRGFLQMALAAAAGAAAATGAGAALLLDAGSSSATITTTTAPLAAAPLTRSQAAAQVAQNSADLFSQLVAAQADNMRLQTELAAAQRKIESLQAGTSQDGMVQAMQTELDSAHQEVGVLAGLVALYEQLDAGDIETVIDNGLAAVGEGFAGLLERLPGLGEGVALGEQVLASLEAQMPLVDSGRQWLAHQLEKLGGYLDAVEQVLQEAAARVGSFLDLLSDWFQELLKWLPFGIGSQAALVVDALTTLLNETPHTINGLRANVAEPLDLWLAEEDGEKHIQRRFITPLRQKTMAPILPAITQTEQVHAAYQTQLAEPTRQALAARRQTRQLIAQYRHDHQL